MMIYWLHSSYKQSDFHKKTEPKAAENETVSNCRDTVLAEAKYTHMLDFLDNTHLALQSVTCTPPDSNKSGNDIREVCFTHNETTCTEAWLSKYLATVWLIMSP